MRFIVYRDKMHEHRWRLVARNGRIVANGGEGYKRQRSCINVINKLILGLGLNTRVDIR